MRVLICGGGVIGASIAWHLGRRGTEVVVIERTGIACAASGKSGGFLALDWCDGTPLEALARRSFHLHAALAAEIEDDWGYRRLTTYAGVSGPGSQPRRRGSPDLSWLSEDVTVTGRLGSTETTAQVDPGRFTAALMRAAQAQGTEFRRGTVEALVRDPSGGRVEGVVVGGETLTGDAVVIAMGPWSILASAWLPLPAVLGLKSHSLLFRTGDMPAEALFLEYAAGGAAYAPELFPRADGTTYVCAISSDAPLPVDPADVRPDRGAEEELKAICGRIAPALADAPVLAGQACYRPVTEDGLPLIGPVPGLRGAYVATGHSVWGILNAPATGEAMAELLLDGAASTVDLAPFDPARLPAFDRRRLRAE